MFRFFQNLLDLTAACSTMLNNIKYGIDPDTFNALGNIDDGTTLHSDPDNIQ